MKAGWSRFLLAAAAIGLLLATRRRKPNAAPVTKVVIAPQPLIEQPAPSLKRWVVRIAILMLLLGIGGFLVAASGIVPIKASSGHWAITRWFLQFSKSRSIATHTIGIKTPPLTNSWQIVKGAAHYETGCAPCHGSPARARTRIADAMLPVPPTLKDIAGRRESVELFYIVKHGIKFTGMPAWPALGRDDEVWALVAFLNRLPNLGADDYRELAHGNSSIIKPTPRPAPELVIERCARCHGVDGLGRSKGAFPKLAGQKREYLISTLEAYANGSRHSGIMEPIAAALSDRELETVAAYYSELEDWHSLARSNQNPNAVERGRRIVALGIPDRGVPPCAECHLSSDIRNRNYPKIAGQYSEYLELQLTLFKEEKRGGGNYSHLMRRATAGLSKDEIRDLTLYLESASDSESTYILTEK